MYFNYICFYCPYNNCNSPNCNYSHNKIELIYHPLIFKKIKCINNNCSFRDTCSFYHTLNEIEYDVNFDSNIMQSIVSLFNNTCQRSDNISIASNSLPSEFNPLTYKTIKCPLENLCKLDSKLCLNYHNDEEKRRKNIHYSSQYCSDIYNKELNTWGSITNCPRGNNCHYCHNKYEYLYHLENFRTKLCPYEKIDNWCEYCLICPFCHSKDNKK